MTELPERKDFGDYGEWPGRAVLDPGGQRLGEVREIYLDDATDRPEWVLVALGDDGARYVPLADATVDDDAIRVAHAADRVTAAPSLQEHKELTQEEERRLYSHYGLRYSDEESDSLLPDPEQPATEPPATDPPATATAGAEAPSTEPPQPRHQGGRPHHAAGSAAATGPAPETRIARAHAASQISIVTATAPRRLPLRRICACWGSGSGSDEAAVDSSGSSAALIVNPVLPASARRSAARSRPQATGVP